MRAFAAIKCCAIIVQSMALGLTPESPIIELSLAPPSKPFPEISSRIGNIDQRREELLSDRMQHVKGVHAEALQDVKRCVGQTVGRWMRKFDDKAAIMRKKKSNQKVLNALRGSTSFLGTAHASLLPGGDKLTVKVNVMPGVMSDDSMTSASSLDLIDKLWDTRKNYERHALDEAASSGKALAKTICEDLETELFADTLPNIATAFLHAGANSMNIPPQANVRVVPSEVPYPTVDALAQAMENRGDLVEHVALGQTLQMQIDLTRAANGIIRATLATAVDRLRAQFGM